MAGFWFYFRDTLAWPLIRRAGALACLVEGLARSLDQAKTDILWLRDQFHPATCEEAFVARLAAARGIARHPLESDAQFRARVVKAYAWQLQGGGQAGLPSILRAYGYPECTVESLREEDPERWAEFWLVAPLPSQGEGFSARDAELLDWVVAEQKPARSLLAGVRLEASLNVSLSVSSGYVTGEVVTVLPWSPTAVQVSLPIRGAAGMQEVEIVTIGYIAVRVSLPIRGAVGMQEVEIVTIGHITEA